MILEEVEIQTAPQAQLEVPPEPQSQSESSLAPEQSAEPAPPQTENPIF